MKKGDRFAWALFATLLGFQTPVPSCASAETVSGASAVRVTVDPKFLQFIKRTIAANQSGGSAVSADTTAVKQIRLDVSMK